jgi:hypothetical protein
VTIGVTVALVTTGVTVALVTTGVTVATGVTTTKITPVEAFRPEWSARERTTETGTIKVIVPNTARK